MAANEALHQCSTTATNPEIEFLAHRNYRLDRCRQGCNLTPLLLERLARSTMRSVAALTRSSWCLAHASRVALQTPAFKRSLCSAIARSAASRTSVPHPMLSCRRYRERYRVRSPDAPDLHCINTIGHLLRVVLFRGSKRKWASRILTYVTTPRHGDDVKLTCSCLV